MKKSLVKGIVVFALILSSCSTNKKVESDDDFSVEGSAPVGTDEVGAATSEDLALSEFDDKPAAEAKSKGKTEEAGAEKPAEVANNPDATLENELNSLGDSTVQKPAATTAPKDELSLDEPAPAKDELSLDDPAKTSVAKTESQPPVNPAETPVAEQPPQPPLTEPVPPPVVATEPAAPTPPPATSEVTPPQETLPVVESSKPATIDNVTYQANANGGTISVSANQPLKFTTRLNSATNQFIVEVENSTIPKKLKRTLNTKDMASTIGSVDIYQKEGSNVARFVVQLRQGSTEPIVQPEGNSLLIIGGGTAPIAKTTTTEAAGTATGTTPGATEEPAANPDSGVAPEVAAQPPEPKTKKTTKATGTSAATAQDLQRSSIDGKSLSPNDEIVDLATPGIMSSDDLEEFLISNNRFYGKKISIETNRMDMKDALRFISEESGVNLIIDDSVNGNVSLKLRSVPWDQALILLLKTKRLGFKRQGSVLRIGRIEDFKKEEQEALEIKESRKARSPFVVKRFFIGYADIKDLEAKIKIYLEALANVQKTGAPTAAGAVAQAGIPGSISAAPVAAAPAKAKEGVGTVLGDTRTNSLIVTDTEENMIKISKLIEALDTQPQQVLIEGKVVEAKEEFTRGLGVNWNTLDTSGNTNTSRIGINPTIDSASAVFDGAFTWGKLDILGSLTARLALGEREDRVRVLSSPRIAVLSNVKATISQTAGFLIPRSSTSSPGTTTVTTTNDVVPVGVTLDVRPLVSNEGTVTLELDIARSFVARIDAKAPEERKARTQVIVKSGQTAVIGGIFESSTTIGKSGVPGFRDLPILGSLFQSESENKSKNELVIFVTPTILKPVVGVEKKTGEIQ